MPLHVAFKVRSLKTHGLYEYDKHAHKSRRQYGVGVLKILVNLNLKYFLIGINERKYARGIIGDKIPIEPKV